VLCFDLDCYYHIAVWVINAGTLDRAVQYAFAVFDVFLLIGSNFVGWMNSSVVLLAADNNGRGSNHARLGVEIGMLRQQPGMISLESNAAS
jgi:hypothetical protein